MAAVVEARQLNKSFGAVSPAKDISVAIEEDTVTGLIGTNGAGKTTFVNMVTGYLKPDSGHILLRGQDITKLHPRQITRLGVSRSFQIPQLYDSMTVANNLIVALGIVLRNSKTSLFARPVVVPGHDAPPVEAADRMLERFGLAEFRDRAAGLLPEGVRKLLDIAMALVVKPKVLMLDEPTSGVSSDEKFPIMDMVMQAVRAEAVTVLFVEHDMEVVGRYAQRVLAFYDGRIIADGVPEVAFANEDVRRYVIGGQRPQADAATVANA
jgi:branched-chain amino acid transport system ATP-binding protein